MGKKRGKRPEHDRAVDFRWNLASRMEDNGDYTGEVMVLLFEQIRICPRWYSLYVEAKSEDEFPVLAILDPKDLYDYLSGASDDIESLKAMTREEALATVLSYLDDEDEGHQAFIEHLVSDDQREGTALLFVQWMDGRSWLLGVVGENSSAEPSLGGDGEE
jgi:hypothetical protein